MAANLKLTHEFDLARLPHIARSVVTNILSGELVTPHFVVDPFEGTFNGPPHIKKWNDPTYLDYVYRHRMSFKVDLSVARSAEMFNHTIEHLIVYMELLKLAASSLYTFDRHNNDIRKFIEKLGQDLSVNSTMIETAKTTTWHINDDFQEKFLHLWLQNLLFQVNREDMITKIMSEWFSDQVKSKNG